ncbi:unnamed protein product [Schistosoma margrebowiei]|uniref:Tetraspanin n=1 Tax=Schistosoma margrebowiei TaxID=48269 RepID=A0A3P7VI18_9TREM|nr:unnamed protein product [Schistosoma margrebowiei]
MDDVIGPMIKKMYGEEIAQDFTDMASGILQLTSPFGFLLFILGLVSLAICLFGFCGACCKSTLCLKVIFKLARKIAHNSLRNYRSIGSNNTDSIIYSVIMPTLNCCGLMNGSDFDDSPNFQRKVLFNEQNLDLKYPIPCCKMDAKFVVLDPTCPGEFNIKNSNIHEGCWVKLRQIIGFYGGMIVICGLVVILFQKWRVGGSQHETLNLSFVLLGTHQQGSPVILKELVLPDGFDPVSPSFTVRDG